VEGSRRKQQGADNRKRQGWSRERQGAAGSGGRGGRIHENCKFVFDLKFDDDKLRLSLPLFFKVFPDLAPLQKFSKIQIMHLANLVAKNKFYKKFTTVIKYLQ
jgi:hypothetical protein